MYQLIINVLRPVDKVIRWLTADTWFIVVDGSEIN